MKGATESRWALLLFCHACFVAPARPSALWQGGIEDPAFDGEPKVAHDNEWVRLSGLPVCAVQQLDSPRPFVRKNLFFLSGPRRFVENPLRARRAARRNLLCTVCIAVALPSHGVCT